MTTESVGTPDSYSSPPVTIILTIILLVCFFVGFFSIYFCRCFMDSMFYSWYFRRNAVSASVGPAAPSGSQGLDPTIIKTFPTFNYSHVKDYRKEKYGLECAICLSEFSDDDMLRLLNACCHVFHQECIDLWLESHKTCPVCRRSLDETEKSPEKSPPDTGHNAMHGINENEAIEDSHVITIKDEAGDVRRGGGSEGEKEAEAASAGHSGVENDVQNRVEKFSRSHSTGHSIVRSRSNEDKFTLKLPEHLHAKLIRGHNWTASCITFGECNGKTPAGNGGFGEVSDFSGEKSTKYNCSSLYLFSTSSKISSQKRGNQREEEENLEECK